MADQKRVQTTYDSGDSNTARKEGRVNTKGDWGNNPDQVPTKTEDTSTLDTVLEDFDTARDFVKNTYQRVWEDNWKCYNGIRTSRGYDGISDDFVPETFTIVESVKANIAGGKPKFNFMPMREEQQQDTLILNNLLSFYWDQNRMLQKTLNWVNDMLVYGNGVLMISWEGDMPRISNLPLADFYVDPEATHMNNPDEEGYPRYAGYRYLTTKEKLKKKKIINPDTGEMEELYKGLEDLEDYNEEWDKLDKEVKEQFLGSTLGDEAHKKQIECIVHYTKDKKYVIANRSKVIYEGKNPYYRDKRTEKVTITRDGIEEEVEREVPEIRGFLPFAILRNYVDSSLFYAKSDVEIIRPNQEALNDVSNQKRDNLTYVMTNMWQIDPQFAHLAEQIESVPGAVYPIPAGALQAIEKQMIGSEADNEMLRIKDEMRRATAADEVVQGVSQDKGRVTATEVQAQLNQASQRFSTKVNLLESEGYGQLGRILFKMVQIFVTTEMAVRIVGPDGVEWKDFDPNEYTGEYEPKVELETTTKAVKIEEGQKYQQLAQSIMNNPMVNQQEWLRVYFDKAFQIPEETIKRLLTLPPPMPMAASPEQAADPLAAALGGAASTPSAPLETAPVI